MRISAPPPPALRALLRKYRITPRQALGQHFLVDQSVLTALINAAAIRRDETVLEIGAGFGILTQALARRAGFVLACELDRSIARALRAEQKNSNVRVLEGDAMKLNLKAFGLRDRGYALVAALPYSISGLVFRNFLTQDPRPSRLALIVQKEVADRLSQRPGGTSVLTLLAQRLASVERIADVPPTAFWPEPAVQSAIVRLTTRQEPFSTGDAKILRLARIGFAARRKMLRNTLAAGFKQPAEDIATVLKSVGIDPSVRAQDLSLGDWERLVSVLDSR